VKIIADSYPQFPSCHNNDLCNLVQQLCRWNPQERAFYNTILNITFLSKRIVANYNKLKSLVLLAHILMHLQNPSLRHLSNRQKSLMTIPFESMDILWLSRRQEHKKMRTWTSASGNSQLSKHKMESIRKVCSELSITRKLDRAALQKVRLLFLTYIHK